MKYLSIYKASAGSGKTHALTIEYLKLAFASPTNYANILAVTFTNKASGEMKGRILNELNILAVEPEKSTLLTDICNFFPQFSTEEISKRALQIFTNILHDYSHFAISTIDSFVQRIIRAFSYEIGLGGKYRLELDSRPVIADLVEILFINFHKDKDLTRWLVDYALHKVNDGKNWDFKNEMQRLAKEIFTEKFQDIQIMLNSNSNIRQQLFDLRAKIESVENSFESHLQEFSKSARKVYDENGKPPEKLGKALEVIKNFLLKKILEPSNSSNLELGKMVCDALNGIENWMAKKPTSEIKQFVEALYPRWSVILADTVKFINQNITEYTTAKIIYQNLFSFGILTDIAGYLPAYRLDNNLLLMSDTTLLLKEILEVNDTSFIYEKTGNRYKHILIDEFQDTSDFQWQNFRPLIKNSIAEGYKNLIVGDVKQSIYRWRGGDWSLLFNKIQKHIGEQYINEIQLDHNWRSLKNVIDFNNAFFYSLPILLQDHLNSQFADIDNQKTIDYIDFKGFRSMIVKAYSDSYQHRPKTQKNADGEVLIRFFEPKPNPETGDKWRTLANAELPTIIDNILRQGRYTPGDITVLVRKNSDGREVFTTLTEYQNNNPQTTKYNIISSESLFIYNTKSIRILISALRYLYNASDKISLSTLIFEYQKINKENENNHKYFHAQKTNDETSLLLPDEFYLQFEHLKYKSLFELVESLIMIFELDKLTEESIYIRTFQEHVYNYTISNNGDLAGFIDWWTEHGHEISVQLEGNIDAVSIMTIHKSKGLGFKIVIIPYCDWKVENTGGMISPMLWATTENTNFNDFPVLPVKYTKELLRSDFIFNYIEEKIYQYMDVLNMLYVAFTRAKDKLIIFAPDSKKLDSFGSVNDLLMNTFTANIQTPTDNEIISLPDNFDSVKRTFSLIETIPTQKQQQRTDDAIVRLNEYPVSDWRKKLGIVVHSDDFYIESLQYVADKVNYGSMMHLIMSKINTSADIDSALDSLIFQGKILKNQKKFLSEKVLEIISRESVKHWFSADNEVIAEKAILTDLGQTFIPDRVIINNNEVVVIDFKFGEQNPDYHQQVKHYVRLIEQMNHKNVKGAIYYADLNIVEYVDL